MGICAPLFVRLNFAHLIFPPIALVSRPCVLFIGSDQWFPNKIQTWPKYKVQRTWCIPKSYSSESKNKSRSGGKTNHWILCCWFCSFFHEFSLLINKKCEANWAWKEFNATHHCASVRLFLSNSMTKCIQWNVCMNCDCHWTPHCSFTRHYEWIKE